MTHYLEFGIGVLIFSLLEFISNTYIKNKFNFHPKGVFLWIYDLPALIYGIGMTILYIKFFELE